MTKANSKLFLVLLLGVLSAFGPFVVDLYLPSLPQLATFFETSASMTQLTLTTAMIGLAVGQLLLGPLSDKFGRKIPLIISLVIYIISTVLIVYAPNIEAMIALRVIQGLSSAGSVVISRAVATDLYRGREMTRFFGLLMTINGLAPIISPILGSLLLESRKSLTRFNIFYLFDVWCDYQKSLIYELCRNSKFLAWFHVCLYCGFAIYFSKFLWIECIYL